MHVSGIERNTGAAETNDRDGVSMQQSRHPTEEALVIRGGAFSVLIIAVIGRTQRLDGRRP